jgi:hypothetical protein
MKNNRKTIRIMTPCDYSNRGIGLGQYHGLSIAEKPSLLCRWTSDQLHIRVTPDFVFCHSSLRKKTSVTKNREYTVAIVKLDNCSKNAMTFALYQSPSRAPHADSMCYHGHYRTYILLSIRFTTKIKNIRRAQQRLFAKCDCGRLLYFPQDVDDFQPVVRRLESDSAVRDVRTVGRRP